MPTLDQLFQKRGTPTFGAAQCFDALVVSKSAQGIFVVLPSYDRHLKWGPCQPASATVSVGDRVSVVISETGTVWLVGGGGGGSGSGGDPNIDGGAPDSVYGGDLPVIDGGGV